MQNSPVDVAGMVIFGVLGYFALKVDFPLPPIAIGFVLGLILEENLRSSLIISKGNPAIFLTEPVCGAFLASSILIMVVIFLRRSRRRLKSQSG